MSGTAWSIADNTISPALAVGTYEVQVAARDAAGNMAQDSSTDELVIEATPTITPTPVITVTATPTPTPVITVTATPTITPTVTPVITATPTITPTVTPVITVTATTTPTIIPLPSETPVTPTPTPDIQAPIMLQAQSGYSSIQLSWSVPSDPQVIAYSISRAVGSATNFAAHAVVTHTTYFDSVGLTKGQTYCYKIVALRVGEGKQLESNVACATYGKVALWVPDVWARPGEKVIVPVNIRNAQGLQIAASNIWLEFDGSIIDMIGVAHTPLTEGYAWTHATNTTNGTYKQVIISSVASPPPTLYGKGSLFWLTFQVLGKEGDTSVLNLRDFIQGAGGSELYAPDDLYKPIPLELIDGLFHAGSAYMLGDVSGNGVVGAEDAALALEIASGKKAATPEEVSAGNVNGNDGVDAADATMILYYASHKTWPTLQQTGTKARLTDNTKAPVLLTIDQVSVIPGGTGETTLRATGLTDWAGGDITIAYEPSILERIERVALTDATKGFALSFNDTGTGLLRISLAKGSPVSGDMTLVKISFRVKENVATDATTLVFSDARLNDGVGRDFATSALQQTINRVDGKVGLTTNPSNFIGVYLPFVMR